MVLEDYTDHIRTTLGAPILELEVDIVPGTLEKIVKTAFFELKEYIDTPFYKTISFSGEAVDLKDDDVRAILYVTRATIAWMNAEPNTEALLWSPLTSMITQSSKIGYGTNYSSLNFLQDYTASLKYRQLRNTLNPDLDFTYDAVNKKLYLYQQVPISSQITIVYNKEFKEIEEIKDPFWTNLLFKLALAYTKQVLGRIRGKFRPASSPFENDADTLLSEGAAELSEIRSFLNENNNIFIPRD